MRNVIAATFISLDGVMQAPGGPEEDPSGGFGFGGWTVPFWGDDAVGAFVGESFASPFALLLGRRTYDIFAGYWPGIETDPAKPGYEAGNAGIATAFNAATKYVATHRPETLAWQHSEALGRDVPARVRALKAQDGPDLLIQGSSVLVHELLAHGLIDVVKLIIFPVVLGTGKRLFDAGSVPSSFTVTKSAVAGNGVIMAAYRRAGDVKTGTFAPEPRPR